MSNICINTLNAEGTPEQVEGLIQQLSEHFGDGLDINDNFATEEKEYAVLTFSSKRQMPQKELLEVTNSLQDTQGLYIRVVSEEPGEEYSGQAVFSEGKWDFETPQSINAQIHALTVRGIGQIRKIIEEKGTIHVKEDKYWIALYVNGNGDGTSAFIQCIELDTNGKLLMGLDDGISLYEEDLTTNHIIDILSLIHEEHVTYSK